jgi:hypothetical protein
MSLLQEREPLDKRAPHKLSRQATPHSNSANSYNYFLFKTPARVDGRRASRCATLEALIPYPADASAVQLRSSILPRPKQAGATGLTALSASEDCTHVFMTRSERQALMGVLSRRYL